MARARRRASPRRRAPSLHQAALLPSEDGGELLHLLVARALVDEHAETPVATSGRTSTSRSSSPAGSRTSGASLVSRDAAEASGADGTRTRGLFAASEALSQLSYSP